MDQTEERLIENVTILVLRRFPDEELAALNNAVQTFGTVLPQNIAYARAVSAALISDSGKPIEREVLRNACTYEINERIRNGSWGSG